MCGTLGLVGGDVWEDTGRYYLVDFCHRMSVSGGSVVVIAVIFMVPTLFFSR